MLSLNLQKKNIIKLRKINRYLFLDAQKLLTDAYNSFDDCILNKITKNQITKENINKIINDYPYVNCTMPRCPHCEDTKKKTCTSNYKANNVLEKCTCPNTSPGQTTNPYQFRKVLASNKTYNYTTKAPDERPANKNQVPCYCMKGNRCYCCFDSTDNDTDYEKPIKSVDKPRVVPKKPENKINKNFEQYQRNESPKKKEDVPQGCKCQCSCIGKQNNGQRHNGGQQCRQDCKCQECEDEFILLVKDKDKKKKNSTQKNGKKAETNDNGKTKHHSNHHKNTDRSSNVHSDYKTTDAEDVYHRRNTIEDVGTYEDFKRYQDRGTGRSSNIHERPPDVQEIYRRRQHLRSNSEASVSSLRNNSKDMSPDELNDINKFRDKYYFECHAIPKEDYYRNHNRRESFYDPDDKECYCKSKNGYKERKHEERTSHQIGQNVCCNCQFCTCNKKPYRLDDYGARRSRYDNGNPRISHRDDHDKRIRSEERYAKNPDECSPSYTINIPEICFKFPINGGKVFFQNKDEEITSVKTSNRMTKDYKRMSHKENDEMSISLRDENGFNY